MKSLRTDDIMGARPRIRHVPRVLVREQTLNDRSYIPQSPIRNAQIYQDRPLYEKYGSYPEMAMSTQLQKKHEYQQSPKKILSKQMPKINYSLPGKNEEHRYNNPERNVSVVEPVKQKVQDERIYSRRSSKSQNEGEKLAEQKKEKANIFRGLGYNIITNHKFSYDMENKYKNETSAWLHRY